MISKATIGRLLEYYEYVEKLPYETEYISATRVAHDLNFGEVQVRKDLAAICGKGRPRVGYAVNDLYMALCASLGKNSGCEAVIVGAGRLGTALFGYNGFGDYGITINHAFDTDPEKFSHNISDLNSLPSYCNLHQVEIGIITTPASSAQEACDMLIKSGIKAIWCFSGCKLIVPDNVYVQYENLATQLAHLHQKVNQHIR